MTTKIFQEVSSTRGNYLCKQESTPVDAQDLKDLRNLGVNIPPRVNRSDTVRKTIQRHIDNLEKKNI